MIGPSDEVRLEPLRRAVAEECALRRRKRRGAFVIALGVLLWVLALLLVLA